MATLWTWIARSLTSPADLDAIELAATVGMLAWSAGILAVVRRHTRRAPGAADVDEELDEAA